MSDAVAVVSVRDPLVVELAAALADPFPAAVVKFKPQMVKNNRCLAMAYIDARLIQDRLDDVVGAENWEDVYKVLPEGSVMCRLRVRLGDRWVTKMDVGSPSEQPDGGDRMKAAVSDALKRAAVKFGVGRYLHKLAPAWVDYDPNKKQIVNPPQLPAWALPKPPAPAAKKVEPPKTEPPKAMPVKADPKPDPAKCKGLPASGQELHGRLREYDAKLAAQKVCPVGALLAHVTQAGVKVGYTADITEWTGSAIQFAVDAVKEFEAGRRAQPTNAA